MDDAAARIEAVVSFLDEHPDVRVYHGNYRKAAAVTAALRDIRSAIRNARRSATTAEALTALEGVDEACREVPRNLRVDTETLRSHSRRIRECVRLAREQIGAALSPSLPGDRLPEEIREEFSQDQAELTKCSQAGAWRACLMVASRLLELVVARKHWEKTGIDPVEQGWTLGRTITEAENAGTLRNQPQVGQILRALNAYRIDSVHVTKRVYHPGPKDVEGVISLIHAVIERLYP